MPNTPNLGLRKIDSKTEKFNQTLNYEENFDKIDLHAGEVIAQLAEKANKAQEGFIELSLLNGWTGTLKYYKNEFNEVKVVGVISGGTTNAGTVFTALPLGYRIPSGTINRAIFGNTQSFMMAMNYLGNMYFASSVLSPLKIDLTFRTDQSY